MGISARALLLAFAYLFSAATCGSILAWLLNGVLDYPYLKILSRSVLLFAAIGLIPLYRAAGLTAAGIGLRPVSGGHVARAFPLGIIAILPVMLFFVVVEFRIWDPRVDYAGMEFWRFVLIALGSGALVGIFEEVLFRGVLYGAIRRYLSFLATAGWVAFSYAAVHFLRGDETPVDAVVWYSGYAHVIDAFSALAEPGAYADSFIALFLLGGLLCWVRERFGLWWCIGLHGAWVFAIRLFKEMTVRDVLSPYEVLVGNYDQFVGHMVSVWLIFIFVLLILYRRVKEY